MKIFNKMLIILAAALVFVAPFVDIVSACTAGMGETTRPNALKKLRKEIL